MNFLYLEINVFGMIMLAIVGFNLKQKGKRQVPYEQKLFLQLIIANIILFLLDSGMWMLDGETFRGCRTLLWIVSALYYVFNAGICFLWLVYADYKLYGDKNRLKKRMPLYSILMAAAVVLVVVNFFTGWIFSISETNVYVRGALYTVYPVISLTYVLAAEALSLRAIRVHTSADERRVCLTMFIFPLPTVAATLIQSLFYGISIIWACTALSLLVIYVKIQNGQIYTDVLTGLFNRRQFERILDQKIASGRVFCVVMIDVDQFKQINDTYGHPEGDEVLTAIGSILRRSCQGDDFAARYGGDEFVLVGDGKGDEFAERTILQIEENVAAFNGGKRFEFEISLSAGYAVFGGECLDAETLIRTADRRMYENKSARGTLEKSDYICLK